MAAAKTERLSRITVPLFDLVEPFESMLKVSRFLEITGFCSEAPVRINAGGKIGHRARFFLFAGRQVMTDEELGVVGGMERIRILFDGLLIDFHGFVGLTALPFEISQVVIVRRIDRKSTRLNSSHVWESR